MSLFNVLYVYTWPRQNIGQDYCISACATTGKAMGPPIAVVVVRNGFHCNATLRFESTVIPFSNYLVVMYDKVTHTEIRPIQGLRFCSIISVRAMVQYMSRRLQRI